MEKIWSLNYNKTTRQQVVEVIGESEVLSMERYVEQNGWGDFSCQTVNGQVIYCRPQKKACKLCGDEESIYIMRKIDVGYACNHCLTKGHQINK